MNIETLQKDMIAAMKAKDKGRKDAISSLVSAVKKTAIDEGCRENIPEELADRVILKELKTAKEQLDTCPEEYAPAMMSEEEVKTYITEKFAEVVATKNKGQIMKAVMVELKGKADGKVINQVVADLCQ